MPPKKNAAISEVERKCPDNQKKIMKAKIKSHSDLAKTQKKKKKIIVKLPTKQKKTKTVLKKTKTVLNKNLAQELKIQLANEAPNKDTGQPTQPAKGEKKKLIIRIKEGVKKNPPKSRVCKKKDSFNIKNGTDILPSSKTCTETPHLDNSQIIQEPQTIVAEPRKKRSYKKRTLTNNVKTLGDSDNIAAEPRKKRACKKKNVSNVLITELGTTTPEVIMCTPDIKVSTDMEEAARKDNDLKETCAVSPVPGEKDTFSKICPTAATDKPMSETSSGELFEPAAEVKQTRKNRKRRVTNDTLPSNNNDSQLDSSTQVPIEVTPTLPRKRMYRKKTDGNTQSTAVEEKTPQPKEKTPDPLFNSAGLTDMPMSSGSSNPPPGDDIKTDFNTVKDIFKKVVVTLESVPKKIITRPKQVASETKLHTPENYHVKGKPNRKSTDSKINNPKQTQRLDVTLETDVNNSDKTKGTTLPSKTCDQSIRLPTSRALRSGSPNKLSNIKRTGKTELPNTPNNVNWSRSLTNSSKLSLNNVKYVENVCIDGLMPKVLVVDYKKEAERIERKSLSRSSTLSNLTAASLSSSLRDGAETIEKAISRPSSTVGCLNKSIENRKILSPAKSEPPVSVLYKDLELSSMSSSSTSTRRSSVTSSRSHSTISISKKTSSLTLSETGKSCTNTESDSDLSRTLMLRRSKSSTSSTCDLLTESRPTILRSNSVLSMASTVSLPPRIRCYETSRDKSPQSLKLKKPKSSKQLTQASNAKKPTVPRNQSPKQQTASCIPLQSPILKTLPCNQSPKQPQVLGNQPSKHPTVPSNQSSIKPRVTCNQSPKQPTASRIQSPILKTLPCNQSPKQPQVLGNQPSKHPTVPSNRSSIKPRVTCNQSPKQPTASRIQSPILKTLPCNQSPKQPQVLGNQPSKHPTVPSNRSSKKPRVTCNQSPKQPTASRIQSPTNLKSSDIKKKVPKSVCSQSPNDSMPICNQLPEPEIISLKQKLQNILVLGLDPTILNDEIVVDAEKKDIPCLEDDIHTISSNFKEIPEMSNNQTGQSNENTTEQKTLEYITLKDIKQKNAKNNNRGNDLCIGEIEQSLSKTDNRLNTDLIKSCDDDGACSDNDDVISLFAESLSEFGLTSISPKHNMSDTYKPNLPKSSTPIGEVIRAPTDRQNYFRPVSPKQAPYVKPMNRDKDVQKIKTICEKQRADSTSVVMNENKTAATDTDSESNYHTQEILNEQHISNNTHYKQRNTNHTQNIQGNNNVNTTLSSHDTSGASLNNHFATLANQYYTSNLDNLPHAISVPTTSFYASNNLQPSPQWMNKRYRFDPSLKFWRKVCLYFLNGDCRKGEKCSYEHRDVFNAELECWIEHVTEEVLALEYLRIRKYYHVRLRYLKSFVAEAIRRDYLRIVIEMLYDLYLNKMVETPQNIINEVTETILLYFNNQQLDKCSDYLAYGEKGNTLCMKMLKFIISSQNFSRYKDIFVKLVYFIKKTLKTFDAQDTMQFLERISLLPFDGRVAKALVTMIKHSDASVMQHKSIDMFEKLISKDETIYNEYIEFKGKVLGLNSSRPNPATTCTFNAATSEGETNTSPDTTNNDVMRNNSTVLNLSPVTTPIFSTAETLKSCDSSQQPRRHSQTDFKMPSIPSLMKIDTRQYRNNILNTNHNQPRNQRPKFQPHFPRARGSHHQSGAVNPIVHRGSRPST